MKGAFLVWGLGGVEPLPKPKHLKLICFYGTLVLTDETVESLLQYRPESGVGRARERLPTWGKPMDE